MAKNLTELFRESGKKVLARYLREVVGEPAEALEEAMFQRRVVTPAWKEMPLPCKLLGRKRLKWDALFAKLRDVAYEVTAGKVRFAPDATARTTDEFKIAVAEVERLFAVSEGTADSIAAASSGPASPQEAARSAADTDTASTAAPTSDAAKTATTASAPSSLGKSPETLADPDTIGHAVGIDLGTTYSAVSFVDGQGRPVSVENAAGELLTPSIVYFDEEGHIVGKEARMAAPMEPDRVAECVKRDMGRKTFRKEVNGELLPPEVISSIILRALKADAERKIGPVRKVVITVPAYFDEPRRRATMDAGRLAGLHVLDIVNEPTAAAVCYGYESGFLKIDEEVSDDEVTRVLVYDLGGGTFDVTILEVRGNAFTALATDGDVLLGGKDWDEKLVDLVSGRFVEKHEADPREDPGSLQELWESVETAKKSLSELSKANVYVSHGGKRMRVEVTRDDFEEATAALLDRTRHTTQQVVRQAGLAWEDIDRVLLVGGSTRMPMVARMLEELTGKSVDRSLSPDVAVAHGAALYAELLLRRGAGQSEKFHLTNVNSHSLGIVGLDKETRRRTNHVLVPKNTPLPCTVQRVCKTAKAGQRSVKLEVLEGESPRPEQCTLVGTSVVRDLPENLGAGTKVLVRYHYEENGRLHVSAKIDGLDEEVTTTFARDDDMGDDEMLAWTQYVAHESTNTNE